MISQIVITSLICFGIFKATREGMILHDLKLIGDECLIKFITYPLYNCPPCMASFWSLVTALYFGFTWDLLLVIPACSGLNYIITRMFPYSED